jgi:hypothetical protein
VTMSGPRRTATILVRAATLALPAGPIRDRYRQELVAELHGLEPGQQLRHALSTSTHALALRRAVAGGGLPAPAAAPRPAPLHCRLHLYHHHRKATTQDGNVYVACVNCGHIKDNYDDPSGPGDLISGGLPMG